MKTTMKLLGLAFMTLSLTLTSCGKDGDDGLDGAMGPAGAQGIAGQDGTNGTNGEDGEDGNANVKTIKIDASAWEGSFESVDVSEITQPVLDNDAILAYMLSQNSFYYAMPGTVDGGVYNTRPYYKVGKFYVNFNNLDGTNYSISAGDIVEVKLIIIESTESSTSSKSGKSNARSQLLNAGVDVNDYHAVMDYYGLNH
ncbi:collagen triple helix repeat protein [Maribacter vaceletii]|uniref:Collagen triple helix repeat protein n=1 Tax=Maribacter vaceletii TaxID=1206816 RepID=A0A495EHE3_9FLAO|nr:collagen-like protein [Maribacter vaceletii]RKR15407.1 collagen triple helix repeat protein [Maribacter vaceletii]